MSQSDRAIKKLATQLARLDRELKSWRGAQADFTSIEGGTMDINDSDGNLVSRVGFQDDGSGAVRFFDGPVPPVPSGVTASADGPIIQATWDGTFEGGAEATYDLAYLEVAATQVDDDTNVSFATITAKEGASASVVADVTGDWVVAVRSVSQAGKKSEFATAGTVEVKLTDVAGAVEAVQDSANGKNKVTYSSHAPTPEDPGIFDDTWFVGQVGRPNDVIEATNHLTNPSFESVGGWFTGGGTLTYNTSFKDRMWDGQTSGSTIAQVAADGSSNYLTLTQHSSTRPTVTPGQWVGVAVFVAHDTTGVLGVRSDVVCSGSATTYHASGDFVSSPFYAGRRLVYAFQVPASAARAQLRVQMYSGSAASLPAGRRLWIDDAVMVVAESEASALTAVTTYFDGDTPSGTTDNESHYRWTGTPHASTSEKYLPALDIGDSSNWNIIEQYRHDGNGWVKVELSHYVFSTVDLGKATVGELDGIRIMAKTVGAEQLRADFADFMVARGATLIAGNDRHRLDDDGYAIFDDNGDRRTFLSPEGSTFKGEVEADTLVVNGGAELRGTNNTLAQGAKLTLAAGVTDPTAPPVVQPYWEGQAVDLSWTEASFAGLAFDGTNYWTANRFSRWIQGGVSGFRALRINSTTGEQEVYQLDSGGLGFHEIYGVTCIGSELFWLYRASYIHNVLVTDLDCVRLREFPFEDVGHSPSNPLVYKPGIGNDGTNVVIAQCTDAGDLIFRTYDKTTGAKINGVSTMENVSSDIGGVYVGSGDFGSNHMVAARASNNSFIRYTMSGNRVENGGWFAANTGGTGVVFHSGKFHSLDPAGKIVEYADNNTGDGVSDWWATYYWYTDVDEDGIIKPTDYQTRMAPPKRFTWPRRAGLKILGQPMPTGVEALGPALAKKTTEPVRTDFSGPGWQVDSGKPSARYITLPTNWQTYASPSATNTFPEAESSVIESASGTFQVKGDGSGKWGPLTFFANGSWSGAVVSGQVVITSPSANSTTSVEVTLPPGRFVNIPEVTTTAYTSAPRDVSVGVRDVSATSFTINMFSTSSGPRRIAWIAFDQGA